jgi:single-strand DNA-binding protein
MYIGVSCWRSLGANVHASLRKGDSVVVHGRLQYREYDDKDGVHRAVFSIDAIAIGPDLSRWPVDVRRPERRGESEAGATTPDLAAAPAPSAPRPDPVAARPASLSREW